MKILLLGKNGQVGWELQRALAPLGTVTALDRHSPQPLTGDLADLEGLRHTVQTLRPDVIVNAAAYTAVDRAEQEQELASRVNAQAPGLLAREARNINALLVHYSTDYVFDGSGNEPWQETHQTCPLNHYGHSKLAGEQRIRDSGCRHLIFRTSWVYAARGNNFLATMSRLIRERESLQVVADQIGAPTGAELIADVSAHAIVRTCSDPSLAGLYHLAARGETSWQGYAVTIAQWLADQGISTAAVPERIQGVPTTAWPTPARRPLNSRLATTRLEQAFGLTLPDWRQGVGRTLAETVTP